MPSKERFTKSEKKTERTNFQRDVNSRLSCRSPGFDAIFLDDSKQKKSYLSALKKKLSFTSTPKATDTDTFLCELSAQFDSEMNLLDDIQIPDEEHNAQPKYGEKWSYLPNKSEPEADVTENPASVTNIDDVINEKMSMQEQNGSTPNVIVQNSKDKKDAIPASNGSFNNDELDTPPFPVNLDNLPAKNRSTSLRIPQETSDIEGPNRTERVRRRRRRNAENIAKRHQIRSEIPEEQDSALQRVTDSFSSIPQPSNETNLPNHYQDEIIYDIPKPTHQTQRRAHVNVEKRSRRTRANRKAATLNKRNSTELRMHVWNENDLLEPNKPEGAVKLRSSSPVDQVSFFDKAKVCLHQLLLDFFALLF